MSLIVSTLPHFGAGFLFLCPEDPLRLAYACVIFSGSLLSALWHWAGQPQNCLQFSDYFLAGVWFVFDVLLSILRACPAVFFLGLLLNFLTLFLWHHMHREPREHALWHLFSAGKSIFLAYLLGCFSEGLLCEGRGW